MNGRNSEPIQQLWTPDLRFGVLLPDEPIQRMLHFCLAAGGNETGGIVVGHYDEGHHNAVITAISGPPLDSRATPVSFYRGTKGLAKWLRYLWDNHRHYYLGEWHFHPGALPHPSRTDIQAMEECAKTPAFRCPEPLLVIVGGNPLASPSLNAFVMPEGNELIRLDKTDEAPSFPLALSCPSPNMDILPRY